MFSIFKLAARAVKPTKINLNKGSVSVVKDDEDYLVKYSSKMDDFIKVSHSDDGDSVDIVLSKDFPDEDPIKVNLKGLKECNISVTSGVVKVGYLCPLMGVRVGAGTVSAMVASDSVGIVKAKVGVGVLKNNSSLSSTDDSAGAGAGSGAGSGAGAGSGGFDFGNMMGGGFMSLGGNNQIQLCGDVEGMMANFEVGSGTLELA